MPSLRPPQSDTTFEEINALIWQHLEERNWTNNPSRGVAVSIALEANELLEHYQWSDKPVGSREELAEELADILIYAFQFAQKNNIDIAEAITQKLKKAAEKYPAELFKNATDDERRTAWLAAKKNYRKTGL
jgi:NTP pyrophosphatase (non-canonical NTP hydrolase)